MLGKKSVTSSKFKHAQAAETQSNKNKKIKKAQDLSTLTNYLCLLYIDLNFTNN